MSAKGAADLLEQIRQKVLQDHNKYRSQHHVSPLILHNTLSKISQDWSDQLLNTNVLKHRPATKFGENLWTGSGFTIEDMLTNENANPVKSWYSEIKFYPDGPFEKYGHFTQLIWKGSKYLGCGISYESGIIFVVCNYDPPGNWRNHYHENVFTTDGLPWVNTTADSVEDESEGGNSGGGGGKGRGGAGKRRKGGDNAEDDVESSADDSSPTLVGVEDREEIAKPYWLYGVGLAVVLLVVGFLAILIYYQTSK